MSLLFLISGSSDAIFNQLFRWRVGVEKTEHTAERVRVFCRSRWRSEAALTRANRIFGQSLTAVTSSVRKKTSHRHARAHSSRAPGGSRGVVSTSGEKKLSLTILGFTAQNESESVILRSCSNSNTLWIHPWHTLWFTIFLQKFLQVLWVFYKMLSRSPDVHSGGALTPLLNTVNRGVGG